ncbi:MAG TPA: glycosyltransferase [Blastocatellia bacterium]|nr:glycosyltransferase [Blastocatellia bacterium]
MSAVPRVAFLTDSYHEINGVALTSRRFEAYALSNGLPFLCVRAARSTAMNKAGSVWSLDLKRGPISFGVDQRQRHDLAFWRHGHYLAMVLESFKPDLIHITGPSDVGQLGAYLAHILHIPLIASWHTDLHKFAGRRLEELLSLAPRAPRAYLASLAEQYSLSALIRFYRIPRRILAPNPELIELLRQRTQKPVFLMGRGVDTNLFSPKKRDPDHSGITLGYVGRLTPEKNVRLLAAIEQAVKSRGTPRYRFLIVGDGYERKWLERNLKNAQFTGVLTGEALAAAYANMDLLLFPSHTDTFGNVVLEALSSGTPAIVTSDGGPKYLVSQGITGAIAHDDREFIDLVMSLIGGGELHNAMRKHAREYACANSWDRVFESVYQAYSGCLTEVSSFHLSDAYAR